MAENQLKAVLLRLRQSEYATYGRLFFFRGEYKVYECCTLELPWKLNSRNVSCIPNGNYRLFRRESPKFGRHWHVRDVAGRDSILIHAGNYATQTQGCILVGRGFRDLNNDGRTDVFSSRSALRDTLVLTEGADDILFVVSDMTQFRI